jgi:predicted lipoprotein
MKKVWIIRISLLLAVGLLLYLFPVFRVESLSERVKQQQLEKFNPSQIVANVWDTDLVAAVEQAPTLETFLQAFRENPAQAITAWGKTVGVSSRRDFMVRIRGRVRELNRSTHLRLESPVAEDLVIEIRNGPVFGNAVRDSSALFDVALFTDTRKFNDLSAELNKRVETLVLPALFEQVTEGCTLEVVGCFSLDSKKPDLALLRLIPVRFKVLEF